MRPVCLLIIFLLFTLLHLDKLIDLFERTFEKEGSPYLACNVRNAFFTLEILKNIMHGRVKMYMMC